MEGDCRRVWRLGPKGIEAIAGGVPAHDAGVEVGDFGREGEAGKGAIASPQPGHLAGGIGLAEAGATVPFIGIDAGFKLGIEKAIAPFNNLGNLLGIEQMINNAIALLLKQIGLISWS